MTAPRDLDELQRIADRSLEGRSMGLHSGLESDIGADAVRRLEEEGLIEILDQDGEPTVSLTDAGLGVLMSRNSA